MKHPKSLQTKRICRYIRVSTDVQEHERQIDSTDSWAKWNGLDILESYEDTEGRNSRDKSGKRVQFQKMLKACEDGKYDAIVVDSLDRFGFRNNKELQHYLYILDGWGVELWSVSQGCISDDDVATVFNTTAFAITSEKEQKEKGLRNLEGRMRNSLKGNWCGGVVPYGMDVICYGSDGKEKWRVVWADNQTRTKYNIDGSTEQYNGKNNFPSRDANDQLRVAPTIRTERLECVRKIYEWFANELISFYQIAVRLNKENLDKGKVWNKGHVQHILNNPVFIGIPTDNKKGQSRFWEFKDGKVREVEDSDESRVRSESDRWRPEKPIFDTVVDPDLWNKVQQKLAARSGNKRHKANPARQAEFWLQPFVTCGGCNRRMRSVKVRNGTQDAFATYYSCATYSTYGRLNATGCENNTVSKPLMEELVGIYLVEAKKKLDFDIQISNLHNDYEPLALIEFGTANGIEITIQDNFKKYLRERIPAGEYGDGQIEEIYRQLDQRKEVEENVRGRLKVMEKEFEEAYQHSKGLTDDAKLRANEEMNHLAAEIKRLKAMLVPQDRADLVKKEIQKWKDQIDHATFLLNSDNHRLKSMALSKCLNYMICRFGKTEDTGFRNEKFGGKKRKSIITNIEIVPAGFDLGLFDVSDFARMPC